MKSNHIDSTSTIPHQQQLETKNGVSSWPKSLRNNLYAYAYEKGHWAGEAEVEATYSELLDFLKGSINSILQDSLLSVLPHEG